jgi:carbamoyl-phosphate synthase small subunit
MKAMIYLEDGTVYVGKAFGKMGTSSGELVFNTSITGYQEILTDPSYAGQIINMTYPLIGNYGANSIDNESRGVYARGFIAKTISLNPSNYKSDENISDMLERMGVIGIYDVDTRSLTKKIREIGAMKSIITTENLSVTERSKIFSELDISKELLSEVSTKNCYKIKGNGYKVAVMDFGIKNNILENLKIRNCDITVFPYNASFSDIMRINPDALLLSNGPGDPKVLVDVIENVRKLIKVLPTFGICLGHQIIALAAGCDTYKMKYGHRGGNHGIYDIDRDRAYITSQNHGYAIIPESIKNKGMQLTHINLNDNTVEGMRHMVLPIFSVQFHPEGAPGPTDTEYLFDKFISLIEKSQAKAI